MGSNTSTNTDTNNIYLEQQYVETIEDKYAELLRQNELLRQENDQVKEDNRKLKEENELIKLGNYNLKRDNDNLREDINNLRLANKAIEKEKLILSFNLDELEDMVEELKQKLPKTDLLPKVAEKEVHRQFMLDCVIRDYNPYIDKYQDYQEYVNKQTELIDTIIRSDEYIVSRSDKLVVTNRGKIFRKANTRNSNQYGSPDSYSYGYTNLDLIIETEIVLNLIVGACQDVMGECGYNMTMHKYTLGLTCSGKWIRGY